MPVKLTASDKEALKLVRDLLEHSAARYPLSRLVRKSGLNADKLKKGFRQLYGTPVHQYHLNHKMNAAKELLTETPMLIDEIAYSLGYNDANNFSAAFKKIAGIRPGEWRRNNSL